MTTAIHSQLLPPNGASYAASLRLTSPVSKLRICDQFSHRGELLSHVVIARDSSLRVFEVRLPSQSTIHSTNKEKDARFFHLKDHNLFGVVTGLHKVETIATTEDGKDRLLVSFKDAKMSLLEWSEERSDFETVSIHTYERSPQLISGLPPLFIPRLTVDQGYRCAALLLPQDAIAILPFVQDASEMDFSEMDQQIDRSLPYLPSFVLQFSEVDARIKNVRDIAFLPGFQKPTIAVLFQQTPTWTGRLSKAKDTCSLLFITLDLNLSHHPIITTQDNLPYDCLYLIPCPQALGGVMIVTPSAMIHIDQSSRVVGSVVNEWHPLTSDRAFSERAIVSLGEESKESVGEVNMKGSQTLFTDSTTGIIVLGDGSWFQFHCDRDGRSVSKIRMENIGYQSHSGSALFALLADSSLVFRASMTGDSELLHVTYVMPTKANGNGTGSGEASLADNQMDLDGDDDLYGDSSQAIKVDHGNTFKNTRQISLSLADTIPAYGPILSLAGTSQESGSNSLYHQLVACTGAGKSGGITYFYTGVRLEKSDSFAYEGPCLRSWSLVAGENQVGAPGSRLLLATTADSTKTFTFDEAGALKTEMTYEAETLAARALPGVPRFIRVTRKVIQVLDFEGTLQQSVAYTDDDSIQASSASIGGTFVALLLNSGALKLFSYRMENGQLCQIHACLGKIENSEIISANIIADHHGCMNHLQAVFSSKLPNKAPSGIDIKEQAPDLTLEEEEIDYGDDFDTLPSAGPASSARDAELKLQEANGIPSHSEKGEPTPVYLFVLDQSGSCALINLRLAEDEEARPVWTHHSLAAIPNEVENEDEAATIQVDQTAQVVKGGLHFIGDHLGMVIIYQSGLVVVFDAFLRPAGAGGSQSTLAFSKIASHRVRNLNESLELTPCRGPEGSEALFISGSSPGWILKTRRGGIQFLPAQIGCDESVCPLQDSSGPCPDFVLSTSGEAFFSRLPDLNFDLPVARQTFSHGRNYSHLVLHDSTRCVVAASAQQSTFILYDEENQPVRDPTLDPSHSYSYRSSLELFADEDRTSPVHGYEFDANEFVCAMETVDLDSPSTIGGRKKFIAVGTVIYLGEDRASRGATYIFDVVETVQDPQDPHDRFRLKLLCKDDAKAPVTALADLNGFLVSTTGQKLYVRAFEKNEWLVVVAFLDVAYFVTSIRVVKNFLLVGDIKKSIWFVGFQEEPYRLVILGKDHLEAQVTSCNFLIDEGRVSFVSTGVDKVVRLIDYSPSVPTSQGGQKLLLKSEFQSTGEASSCITLPLREGSGEGFARSGGSSSKIYTGLIGQTGLRNGAIEVIMPVRDVAFKRLQLLQGQLVRAIQHIAGLNPRSFRAVRNEFVSRPLVKGILDGSLLALFAKLPKPKMLELSRMIPDCADPDELLEEATSFL
ncbi:hypothetical protein IE53DRAFT_142664 [Violaceomyces palustris]|uniref:Uncharacterized protein n=1 Tax=Violaceomyces palustris TaxID=1673888 RepID=A0ACD0NUT0_9BASI|nr:hypothetical protein IE53DRAFT_142664 [Violaceomyces palustris]